HWSRRRSSGLPKRVDLGRDTTSLRAMTAPHLRAAIVAAALALAGAAFAQTPAVPVNRPPGIDIAGMDRSVKPGHNFFEFANGDGLASSEIPPDRANWGTSGELAELTNQRVRAIIEGAVKAAPGSEARRVGDYYSAYMDEAAIEKAGLAPLQPRLARI